MKYKKFFLLIICVMVIGLQTGCGEKRFIKNDMRNVEERDFATILLVAPGEDEKRYEISLGVAREKRVGEESETEKVSTFSVNNFEELAEEYRMVEGKDLSLAHLKVILLSFDRMNVMMELQEILYALDENEEIAKTCPVLQLQDKERFLEYLKDAKMPVGTHISNLIAAGERQGKNIPWLKDYLKVIREGDAIITYFLEWDSKGWQVRCYSSK